LDHPDSAPPCADYLGAISHEIKSPGEVCATFRTRAEMANPFNQVQGGILAAMLDHCLGFAAHTTDSSRPHATLSLTVQYLRPVTPGEQVRGEAVVVKDGRTAVFLEATLLREDGQVAAKAAASGLRLRGGKSETGLS